MEQVSVIDVIRAKRDKKELTEAQIKAFISKLSSTDENGNGAVHEAQIGAFLMAVFINGLSKKETVALTQAMTYSGFTFNWPTEWKHTVVDKHSTGGIGDKTSLILAPALAACGLRVPMVSGRGLDITGGTLDKLESIPGFNVSLSADRITELLRDVGCCIVGQTSDLVPADKFLYRIRDTTATVDYENLIVASIISKKASENLDALVLDIKYGSGALMKDIESARSLAANLVTTGNSFGMKVSGFITKMDTPLGRAVGNALEVAEAIDTLQNHGPEDLLELVIVLGGKLLQSTGCVKSLEAGRTQITEAIRSGRALEKFEAMLVGQGTEARVAEELCRGDKWKYLARAKSITTIKASCSGYIETIDALAVGKVSHGLGCGRSGPGLPIKFEPGIILCKKPGDLVSEADVLMEIHHDETASAHLINSLHSAVKVGSTKPTLSPLVLDLIE